MGETDRGGVGDRGRGNKGDEHKERDYGSWAS